ncbi:hypothetical protein CGSHiEE_02455 [Haemophilus influenzae PittEE]|nr:hypothetical protein CGSHiEE_02455 [Haemophilus influenzae PittEE]
MPFVFEKYLEYSKFISIFSFLFFFSLEKLLKNLAFSLKNHTIKLFIA